MRLLKLVLSVLVMLILSGCCSTPLISQTVPRQTPAPCLTQCVPLPNPVNNTDLEIRRWEFEAVELFGQCRRLHANCVESVQ